MPQDKWVDIDDQWEDVWEDVPAQQPSTGRSHGPLIDSLWNFGAGALSRGRDIVSGLLDTPASQFARATRNPVDIAGAQNFGNTFQQSPTRTAFGALANIDPTGTVSGYSSGIGSLGSNLADRNYGGAALDAGLLAAGPALGLRGLLRNKAPQVMPQRQPIAALPAMGQSSASTPRFYSGSRGIADSTDQFPYTLAPFRTNAVPIKGEGGRFVGAHVAEKPAIVTPDIGAELGATLARPNRPVSIDKGGRITPKIETDEFGRIPVPSKSSAMKMAQEPVITSEIPTDAKRVVSTPNKSPIGMPTQIIGAGKAVASSVDISAPLRQGINLVHKKEWRDALVPMIKSWRNEKNFKELEASIQANPRYKLGQEAGLGITDRITNPEDVFISTLPEKIPYLGELFKGSNRAYTGFLNKLRQDTFTSLVNAAELAEPGVVNNLPRMKEIASYVNNATGRGSLGKLEKNSQLLNNIFFSPRFVSSRVQMMNPANYISKNVSPQVRKEYLKSFLATSAFGATSLGLAKLAGADVDLSNPTKSDFLKAKFGNTRLDPWGGYQQYLVAGNRMLDYGAALVEDMVTGSQRTQEEFGTFKKPSAWETTKRFTEGKFNPVVSFTTAMLNGREFSGVPFEIKNSIGQHFTPMVARDLVELLQEDPSLLKLAGLGIPASLGMGVQTYANR